MIVIISDKGEKDFLTNNIVLKKSLWVVFKFSIENDKPRKTTIFLQTISGLF